MAASWDDTRTSALIDSFIAQLAKGTLAILLPPLIFKLGKGTDAGGLKKEGWTALIKDFREKTGASYDKAKLQSDMSCLQTCTSVVLIFRLDPVSIAWAAPGYRCRFVLVTGLSHTMNKQTTGRCDAVGTCSTHGLLDVRAYLLQNSRGVESIQNWSC
jgi:hypothetical protein